MSSWQGIVVQFSFLMGDAALICLDIIDRLDKENVSQSAVLNNINKNIVAKYGNINVRYSLIHSKY